MTAVQAFRHQTQMLLFHAVPFDQIMQLQAHRQPGFLAGALGGCQDVSAVWYCHEAYELEGWLASVGMTDTALPSLRLAAKSLAASEPFMQTALQRWAAECPTLTGVGRFTQTTIGPGLQDLTRLLVSDCVAPASRMCLQRQTSPDCIQAEREQQEGQAAAELAAQAETAAAQLLQEESQQAAAGA